MKKSIGAIISTRDPETWAVLHRLRNGQRKAHPRKAAPKPRPAPWSGYAQMGADYRQQLIDKGFLRPAPRVAQKATSA